MNQRNSCNDLYLLLGKIKTLEPLIVTHRRGVGGYVETLRYIPSTTIRGAIVSILGELSGNEHLTYDKLENYGYSPIISTAGFPVREDDSIKHFDPPRLPLRTIARTSEGKYVSTAILWAKYYVSNCKDLLYCLTRLDYKVDPGFWIYGGKSINKYMPKTLTYTHVSLDYETRTSAENYLYTIDAIRPGTLFLFKLLINRVVLDKLASISRSEASIVLNTKIGSQRSRGYGLIELTLKEPMNYCKYLETRSKNISANSGNLVVIDVLSETPPEYIARLISELAQSNPKKIVYSRYRLSTTKRYYEKRKGIPRFILTRIIEPGSTLVFRFDSPQMDILTRWEFPMVELPNNTYDLYTPTFFINNPIHFVGCGSSHVCSTSNKSEKA